MASKISLQILLLELAFLCSSIDATFLQNLSPVKWDGVILYIPVSRQRVQDRLDEYNNATFGDSSSLKLYLPDYTIFPGLTGEDQHMIYLDFGYLTFTDFEESVANDPNSTLSMSGVEVAVNIPLLSVEPDGPPAHSLALAKFYDRRRGDIPKANILYPYIPVDEIVMDDCHVVVKNGEEEIRASFQRSKDPCLPPPDKVDNEIKQFMGTDFHFGNPEPRFSFCDRHPFDNNFCNTAKSVRSKVQKSGPNICQFWRIDDINTCATTSQVHTMTKYFRDFILLGDDSLNIVASETMVGNFSIGLKYPCLGYVCP